MRLSDKHRKQLRGLSDDVIQARGYRTIDDADELKALGFGPKQRRVPALLVPVTWQKQVVLHQVRPDQPRRDAKDRVIKYETPKGARMRLDCAPSVTPLLQDPTVDLWVTEGVKKADAAASIGLCCVALLGVWNWRGTGPAGESGPLSDWDDVNLNDRDVYVAFDSDVMVKPQVQGALQALTMFLSGRGGRVHWVHLPAGEVNAIDGSRPKVGLDDYLASGHDESDLRRLATRPALAVQVNGRSLPDMTRDGIALLHARNEPPVIFQRYDEALIEASSIGVQSMSRDRLRYRLSEAGDWYRVRVLDGGEVKRTPVNPPGEVVGNISVARDLWSFPVLDRIVTTPVFAGDGSLRSTPGYHAASRTLFVPPEGLVVDPVPDEPRKRDVRRALAAMDALLQDFAFVDDADRAHALALLLQPFARELIRGVTPLYGVEAPKQGTGKTVLVRSLLAPAVGEVRSYAEPHGDEEMEKRLTASMSAADPVIFFDNVSRTVNYPSLASALTTGHWQGRMLGQSQTIQAPVLCTWVLTANNPQYSDDMARRVARIRLDAKMENPHTRSGFILSLPSYALEERGVLIWAACVLIRSWVVAGRQAPPDDTPHLASYGAWRRVLGGVLGHHGIPGFLGNVTSTSESGPSPESEVLAFLLYVARKKERGRPFKAADVVHYVEAEPDICALLPSGRETLAQRLGKFLRAHKGQIVSGYRLDRSAKRGSSGFQWEFVKVEGPS